MSIPTAAETALLRSQPQQTKLWLSVFNPNVALACQVNDASIAKGARVITYDTVSAGTYLDVRADFTMLIGSTAGASDIGRIRVRSITTTQITVAENSDIRWDDNQFLTILEYVDITAMYPRIIQDPANATNTIWYKDYDILYTNQNSVLGTLICAGPHRAGFINLVSGVAQFYYASTGSYNVMGNSYTLQWAFEGGTPSTFSGNEPGLVGYATPGSYLTTITATGTNFVDTSYRFISVYNRPGQGSSTPPYLAWEVEEFAGSRQAGGYSVKIKVFDDVSAASINANSLVVIFADTIYGTTEQHIGGNAKNSGDIIFCGYIANDSITYNYKAGWVEFEVESASLVMQKREGFSVSCESRNNPNTWFKIKDMSVTRAIYHYLRWHSTVLKVCDFQYTGTDDKVQYFDANRESLYDAIASFLKTGLEGELVCDRQGKLWAEVSAGATPTNEVVFDVTLVMNDHDYMGEPNIDERLQSEVSYIERGGIAYSGSVTGTFAAFLSGAPGQAPSYSGSPNRQQGLILHSRNQLNQLTGDLFAYMNSPYPDVDFTMRGNYLNLDIAPIEEVDVNVAASDTPRGIALVNEPFHITRLEYTYNSHNLSLISKVNLAQLVGGVNGSTIRIPTVPPGGGFRTPPISIPQIPAITLPPFPSLGGGGVQGYIALVTDLAAGATDPGLTNISWTLRRSFGTAFSFPSTYNSRVQLNYTGFYSLSCNVMWPGATTQSIYIQSTSSFNDSDGFRTASPFEATLSYAAPALGVCFYAAAGTILWIEGSALNSDVDNAVLNIMYLGIPVI